MTTTRASVLLRIKARSDAALQSLNAALVEKYKVQWDMRTCRLTARGGRKMSLVSTRLDRCALRCVLAAACGWLAVVAAATPAQGQCSPHELEKLIASDAAASDNFGISVAVSGDTAMVGANVNKHAGGITAGSAYVFSTIINDTAGDTCQTTKPPTPTNPGCAQLGAACGTGTVGLMPMGFLMFRLMRPTRRRRRHSVERQ